MEPSIDVRPSPIAGRWYPGDPKQLAQSVDEYIAQARLPELQGEVIGIMTPHAGHVYSGPVAGYAFAAVKGMAPEVVAVVSPMHHGYSAPLLTTGHQAYATPLGEVEVERTLLGELDRRLTVQLGFGLTGVRRDPEHSLEIELPFLQRALAAPFELLPIMVREQDASVTRPLGEALASILAGKRSLLVASTDLSHFYPQKMAQMLDSELLRRVANFDPQGVLDAEDEGVGFACGKGALAAVLWAAREMGANKVQVLHHATSGDVSGDLDGVVGYGAAAILKDIRKSE
jgi:AmmeMemoRadiSam system protein B